MKVVLLAGGFGTRISEESYLKPKPMIKITLALYKRFPPSIHKWKAKVTDFPGFHKIYIKLRSVQRLAQNEAYSSDITIFLSGTISD